MMTDSIANFLTLVRNAVNARHKKVDVQASKMRISMADIFRSHGFIRNYKLFRKDNKGVLRIYLKYSDRQTPIIQGLQRVSRPSRRVYASYKDLHQVKSGIGVALLSTPKGVISDENARELKVGGEVLCKVW